MFLRFLVVVEWLGILVVFVLIEVFTFLAVIATIIVAVWFIALIKRVVSCIVCLLRSINIVVFVGLDWFLRSSRFLFDLFWIWDIIIDVIIIVFYFFIKVRIIFFVLFILFIQQICHFRSTSLSGNFRYLLIVSLRLFW